MKKKLVILGSTGSIGTQTLSVVDAYPDKFEVVGLACRSNYQLLNKQIEKYKPKYVSIAENKEKVKANGVEMLDNAVEISRVDADIAVTGMVGLGGLAPTLAAIDSGKNIALANKETLVACGELVIDLAKHKHIDILPVDSEHSAIWQCMNYGKARHVKKLILTASGGAFRDLALEELEFVGIADALKHPTWKMGRKVTIDSATMMNKGLEIIEAMHLFGMGTDKIDVLIHRESIVHSMVMYDDNSVLAEMSSPSMVLPIQLALTYPEKIESTVEELDLARISKLSFERPDTMKYRALPIAYEVGKTGGTAGAIMNGANETAVKAFSEGKIKFINIPDCIEYALNTVPTVYNYSYGDVVEADLSARKAAEIFIRQHN